MKYEIKILFTPLFLRYTGWLIIDDQRQLRYNNLRKIFPFFILKRAWKIFNYNFLLDTSKLSISDSAQEKNTG